MAIDEKKLIEDFKNTFSDSVLNQTFGFGKYSLLEAIEEMINRQPQANCSRREWYQKGYQDGLNSDKWIPCEERLPEPIRPVLVTVKNWINDKQFVRMGRFHTNHWEIDGYVVVTSKVIAWQPLPQPYKKECAE